MRTIEDVKKLEEVGVSVITIDGEKQFGIWDEKRNVILEAGTADKGIQHWLLEWNIEELTPELRVSESASMTIRALDKGGVRKLKASIEKLIEAKETGLAYWENKVFEQYL